MGGLIPAGSDVRVDGPPRVWEVACLIPGQGHNKDFINGINGFPSLALRVMGLAFQLTGWCQDKWTSATGYLPRKRLM